MDLLSPADFRTIYGFRRPGAVFAEACGSGLRSGLSLHLLPDDPGLRCRPSSLYTFPAPRAGLGSGLPVPEVSPILSSSASPVSLASTQVFLKSAASAIPPRPRGLTSSLYDRAGWPGFCTLASPLRLRQIVVSHGKLLDAARALMAPRGATLNPELVAKCRQSAAGIVHGIVGTGCVLAYHGVLD